MERAKKELEEELTQLGQMNHQLQEELEKCKRELEESNYSQRAIKEQNKQMEAEMAKLRLIVQDLSSDIKSTQEKNDILSGKHQQLMSSYSDLQLSQEKGKHEYEMKLQQAQESSNRFREELIRCELEKTACNAAMEELRNSLSSLQNELISERKSNMTQMEAIQRSLAEEKRFNSTKAKDYEQQIERLESGKSSLMDQITSLKQEYRTLKEQLEIVNGNLNQSELLAQEKIDGYEKKISSIVSLSSLSPTTMRLM